MPSPTFPSVPTQSAFVGALPLTRNGLVSLVRLRTWK